MLDYKKAVLAFSSLIIAIAPVSAQDTAPKSVADTNAKPATNAVAKVSVKQADVASKTASFAKVSKTYDAYKSALDAHDLEAALKQTDKDGAFKGKVPQIFEPRGGAIAIVNFDANYRNALTALLKKADFNSFPPLTNLVGKEILVSGKFIDYQGRSEIVLTNTAQVKLVE